ncbi:MAG: PEGA domain-containing protein [Kofleriaceae bacterium]
MRIALILALALALVFALGSAARADDVGVIVDGEASTPQLTAQLAAWLTKHGYTPVISPLPPETVGLFTDAMRTNSGNAREILEKHATPASMVYVRVEIKARATSGARDLTLSVYWMVKGHDATAQTKDCERCTDQLVRGALEDLLRKLIGGGAFGHLKLKSSPPGARISIDNQPIGVTPLDWDLTTGKHMIQMDKAGLKPVARELVIASDKLELVVMTLEPIDAAGGGGGHGGRLVPALVLTAGVGLLATGAVMIAIDQDSTGNAATYRDTGPAGVGFAIGGAVVTGVGAYLLYRTRHTSAAPVAAVSRDMAYVGWLGQF